MGTLAMNLPLHRSMTTVRLLGTSFPKHSTLYIHRAVVSLLTPTPTADTPNYQRLQGCQVLQTWLEP